MKKLLHVGCGSATLTRTTKGFNDGGWVEVRLDIDEKVNPDVIASMTDMRQVESGSIDAVFSSHNLEHLFYHEVFLALSEFRRVLKEDGFCVITCPDLQSVCELVAQDKLMDVAYMSPAGPISPIDMVYGHRRLISEGKVFMAHRCGFTQSTLTGLLKECGFKSIASMRQSSAFSLWAVATKNSLSDGEIRSLAGLHFRR